MKRDSSCYDLWTQLRAFSNEKGIPFHNKWNIFSHFYNWFRSNKFEGSCLDYKMIEKLGSVSPETCLFVPKKLIMLFVGKNNKRDLPTGVYPNVGGRTEYPYRVISYLDGKRQQIGVYETAEEAKNVYALSRLIYSLSVVESYEDILNDKFLDLYKKECYIYYREVLQK